MWQKRGCRGSSSSDTSVKEEMEEVEEEEEEETLVDFSGGGICPDAAGGEERKGCV